MALCGEFVSSASQGKDIIEWQQPDLRRLAKFGQGDGSVKALVTVGNRVFTAHQDGKIRVWKVSRSSENLFRLSATLPTTKDYLGNFIKQSNYVQTRRNHRRLWIEHADSISFLAFCNGFVYSGSWDKTLKVWRITDLKCVESIRAHDDAINALETQRCGLLGLCRWEDKVVGEGWCIRSPLSHGDVGRSPGCCHKCSCGVRGGKACIRLGVRRAFPGIGRERRT